ncbi:peptidoglycan-binding protein [Terrabacter sp. MAHUQ-38]|uniref:peptidoglycan-binding protein n=1 Tax=unclassified Terrabacter TaxID=2630222 RepID=UPI00165E907A|nr:peptidoglycan-binding protein [Terrabacter sp. MAHUQ-38]MBC9820894.1 peptidoglycan-binding protein [Terrabacter sp. MAHUQ-38]
MSTIGRDRQRTVNALAAVLTIAALVATAPAAQADDATGTPTPTTTTSSAGATDSGTSTSTDTSTTTSTPSTTTSTTTTTTVPITTPPPTSPVVLSAGDTGWAVKDLQSRLAVLGHPSGTIDGVYDSGVASALAGFLSANSLPGDGSQLTETARSLLTKQTASALVIAAGSSGWKVKDLQVRLRLVKAAYWTYAISGVYGWTLGQRVLTFQRDQNLPQSGVVDQRTWNRLVALTATTTRLREGASGWAVKDLQVRLRIVKAAYWTYAISGVYGWTLGQRVLTFQRDQNLPQSGVLDQRTWGRLVALTRTATVLSPSSPVANIRELQRRLATKGLWPYAFSGVYGWTLGQKVLTFQRLQNLPQSGLVDQRTWTRILAVTYVPGSFDSHRYYAGLRPLLPSIGSLDPRCRTGRVMCVDKRTRTLTWVVDGRPLMVMWARFGMPGLETREGTFSVFKKYEYVVSNLYFTPMPYSMFFSGGQAVHYSSNFARLGYATASHGCVNIADYAQVKALYFKVRIGDKVVVYH